ncbi:HAMP domain-containing sensor histidine kinase [Oceanirhabdus sp. W0125-5]|uniref:HAMP domain-containing sensor histidine kinase n=1 Tax=Oceanirhabdus sp. W0125-5 TaxID=2999116 RepID=UPI0022F30F57|nr:HAMP domain-containing sensor histidine kinase [Oceanirhabdus sp. W0125-5]WBW97302.1 HAMP domain-containing sensor histidine kinase [Oceanirhabdus sp. W0125-5]
MKKNFRSISWKIWRAMTRTILILLVLVLLANITFLRESKKDFIYDQLKESAKAQSNRGQSTVPEDNHTLWVAHFKIQKDQDKFNIFVDPFTKSQYVNNKEDELIIESIVDQIEKENIKDNKGIIKDGNVNHYYYVDWYKTGKEAKVFLTSTKRKTKFDIKGLIIILVLLIISFFSSRITAKKIAKPIQELEFFAEEISKRNWNASVPKTDRDEIGLLSDALEKMRDSLRVAEERDRQFLQSTSHDLKTPVMIIKGYAQALLDGVDVTSEESIAEVIKIESERLERKITQLLRLNTLGHSLEYSENRELIRIDRLLRSLISKFSVVRPELKWKTNLKELEVKGDSEALLIAFENIIENQIRYAKNYVKISMDIEKKIEIKISNDGPHFGAADPMILFDSYKKDKEGQFGLGLAIVKQVIEAHNGKVAAYNIEEGVEFKIVFINHK